MNPMVPGLVGSKMSSSVPDSKIEFLDSPETIRRKIFNAPCEDGQIADNGLLSLLSLVVFPARQHILEGQGQSGSAILEIQLRDGEARSYVSYEAVEADFASRTIQSDALKEAITASVSALLAPLRKLYESDSEWRAVELLAYPESV